MISIGAGIQALYVPFRVRHRVIALGVKDMGG
jgi:hypothetical protein